MQVTKSKLPTGFKIFLLRYIYNNISKPDIYNKFICTEICNLFDWYEDEDEGTPSHYFDTKKAARFIEGNFPYLFSHRDEDLENQWFETQDLRLSAIKHQIKLLQNETNGL